MDMDRNITPDGKGKYALVKMREIPYHVFWDNPIQVACEIIRNKNILDYGIVGTDSEFFVIRLKDKHAVAALTAYAKSIKKDDAKFAAQVMEMVARSKKMKKKKPD